MTSPATAPHVTEGPGLSLGRMRRILEQRRGAAQAIRSRDLAALLGVTDGPAIRGSEARS